MKKIYIPFEEIIKHLESAFESTAPAKYPIPVEASFSCYLIPVTELTEYEKFLTTLRDNAHNN